MNRFGPCAAGTMSSVRETAVTLSPAWTGGSGGLLEDFRGVRDRGAAELAGLVRDEEPVDERDDRDGDQESANSLKHARTSLYPSGVYTLDTGRSSEKCGACARRAAVHVRA